MPGYDVIVIGARVAGAPTAMLLAQRGHRVLVVDRATFPSDTMSTHVIHPLGMSVLHRWGLAEHVTATGCPPLTTYRLDFGPVALAGRPRGASGAPHAYAPRRVVLDALLVEAAAAAGAEVREGFTVESLIVEDGVVCGIRGRTRDGRSVAETGRIVVGADGVNSVVARSVNAPRYNEVPAVEAMYYSYWSGLPTGGEFQIYVRDDRAIAAIPTHDDLTVALVAWPIELFEANKRDLERNYLEGFEAEPSFAERIRGARRESRIVGTHMDNFYRQSFGPGWALVGDAGYHKDAVTAQGITDAFRDAESLTQALDDFFQGRRSYAEALTDYQDTRDMKTAPMYELTCQLASFEPPPQEMEELLGVLAADPSGADDLMSTLGGTMGVGEFFEKYAASARTA